MEERRQQFKVLLCAVAAGSFVGGLPDVATAAPIDDRSFFDSIPHTFLDFETDGDGNPVNVANGVAQIMNREEYDAFGMRWNVLGSPFWGNPSDPDVEAAIAAAGSPNHVVGWSNGVPGFFFDQPMRSFGFSMFIDTRFVTEPIRVEASLFDGTLVETVFFNQGFIDGQVGDIAFGFIGLTTEIPIVSVVIFQDNFFAIDDLHFSAIPAPGAVALLPLAGVLARRRRRVCDV